MCNPETEAINIYDELLKCLPTLKNKLDYLNPPRTNRIWRNRGSQSLDENKDWNPNYDQIKHFRFVIREYQNSLNALIADGRFEKIYRDLYVFDNLEGAEGFSRAYPDITDQSSSEIFEDPKNREFDPLSMHFILNQKEEDIRKFCNYLASLAQDMRIIDRKEASFDVQKSEIYKLSRIYCLGPQGIGKTTLLNYMFSSYSMLLFKKRVLWIRIDFNLRKQRYFNNLSDAILSQFSIIFHKFYLKSYETHVPVDWKDVKYYMERNFGNACAEDSENFRNLTFELNVFEQVSKQFILKFISYLREKGWAFIFIIDGLDRTSLEQYDTDTWKSLTESLSDTIYDTQYIKAIFILSLRYSSYKYLLEHFEDRWSISFNQHMAFYLYAKDLNKILMNKFLKAENTIIDRKKKKIKTEKDKSKYDLIDYDFLKIFRNFILKISMNGLGLEENDAYSKLLKISGYNYRIMFRCLQKVIEYFGWLIINHFFTYKGPKNLTELERDLDRKKYYVLKAFMMGNDLRKDYLSNYTYLFDGNTLVFKRQGYGRALAPNIINYIEKQTSESPWSSDQIRTLLKIRCIEYFLEMGESELAGVVDYLSCVYRYDKSYILAEIEEMICETLIVSSNIGTAFRSDFVSQISKRLPLDRSLKEMFRVTSLGRHLYLHILNDVEYLGYAIQDVPIPKELSDKMMPINFFWRGVSTNEYVANKVYNVLIFVHSFLKFLEESEDKIVNQYLEDGTTIKKYSEVALRRKKIYKNLDYKVKDQVCPMLAERLYNSPEKFKQALSKICPELNIS